MAHDDDKTELNPKNVEPFIEAALERFKETADAEDDTRKLAREDLKFSLGDQWPTEIEDDRTVDLRPCLTLNRMNQFVRHVTNQQKQQRPAISVNPADDDSSVDSAKILQGIMRHIEYRSESKGAWDHAFEMMCRSGLGYVRIEPEYLEGDTIEQEIKIKRVKNPFSVYFDPFCKEADYSDARFAFVIEDMPREQFKIMYPNAEITKVGDFSTLGDTQKEWVKEHSVRVAEYFYVEETKVTLYQLSNGDVTRTKPTDEELVGFIDVETGEVHEPISIFAEHEKIERDVKWVKMTALEILEEEDSKGKFIPIVPVLGDDFIVDGKRHLAGMVRDAKDPQRVYNYQVSNAIETIALAPRAPFIVVEGQLEGHEEEWAAANRRNYAYLTTKGVDSSGNPVPTPQRQVYEPPIQAMMLMTAQADNDMKAIFGIYDASLGARGPEQSGKAILARQSQSDIGNLNYSDNLALSYRYAGKIILDLIPHIYTVPRVQKIVNPDGQIGSAILYKGEEQKQIAEQMMEQKKIQQALDVSAGRYSLTVSQGPSHQTKRQEQAASMIEFLGVYPDAGPLIADMLVESMDWVGAEEIAKRLKFSLPPQLQGEESQQDPKMQVVALQGQLQQMSQQHEEITKALQALNEERRTKVLELSSKERIASMNAEVELMAIRAKMEGEANLKLLTAQIDSVKDMIAAIREGAKESESAVEATAT